MGVVVLVGDENLTQCSRTRSRLKVSFMFADVLPPSLVHRRSVAPRRLCQRHGGVMGGGVKAEAEVVKSPH